MTSFDRQDEKRKTKLLKIEEKWKILFNQATRPPIYNAQQYVENLKKYIELKTETPQKPESRTKDERPVSYLLRKLKMDLQMSFESFSEEFVSKPHCGLALLLKLLKNIQKNCNDISQTGSSKAKAQSTKKLLTDEHDCLLCIKFSLRAWKTAGLLLDESYGLETVASSLMSAFVKSRLAALEIMRLVLTDPRGFVRNLDCFTYFRLKNCEPVRFRFLISMMMSSSTTNLTFQVCCMKFVNTLLTAAPDLNDRVYIQSELKQAGLDVPSLLQQLDAGVGLETVELERELLGYKSHLLNIDDLIYTKTSLEIDYLDLQKQVSNLQDEIENSKISDALSTDNSEGVLHNIPDPPPLPPLNASAPDQTTKAPDFPFLNWKPLKDTHNTLFETFKGATVLNESELHTFIQTFQLQKPEHKPCHQQRSNKHSSQTQRISLLTPSRSQHIAIVLKCIGQPPSDIGRSIEQFDSSVMTAENCDLLMQILPSENEKCKLTTQEFKFSELAEEDQLILYLVSVEELESKLKILIYMGQFHDKLNCVKPVIDAIRRSSLSLLSCTKLHRVFEIILFLFNVVSSKREACGGFRLSSLSSIHEMRSHDRTKNLMDFIVEIIDSRYPDVLDWCLDMDLPAIPRGSLKKLTALKKDLGEGMENLQYLSKKLQVDNINAIIIFTKTSEDHLTCLHDEFEGMEKSFGMVCRLYGEDIDAIEPSNLFGYVRTFREKFQASQSLVMNGKQQAIVSSYSTPKIDYPASEVSGYEPDYDINIERETPCDCCNQDRELCSLEMDPYGGLTPTENRTRVENWIVQSKDSLNITGTGSKQCSDEDSCDSAFGGSEGNILKSFENKSRNKIRDFFGDVPRTSTPLKPVNAPISVAVSTSEPPPDYSVRLSPTGSERSNGTYSSELSKILNEFEGNLNKYETETIYPRDRKMYVFRSAVFL